MKDQLQTASVNIPAASGTAYSTVIDIKAPTGAGMQNASLWIDQPAMPNQANGVNVTFTWQDSADGSSFATLTGAAVLTRTGAGGAGAAAARDNVIPLPANCRRYIRFAVVQGASSGDSTAVKVQGGVKY